MRETMACSSSSAQYESKLGPFRRMNGMDIAIESLTAKPMHVINPREVSMSHATRKGPASHFAIHSRSKAVAIENNGGAMAAGGEAGRQSPPSAWGARSRRSWTVTGLLYHSRIIAAGWIIGSSGILRGQASEYHMLPRHDSIPEGQRRPSASAGTV